MVTLRGRSGEIEEMLERRSVDICCVKGTRFWRKSVRMVREKATEYKLLWIGNEDGLGVGVFLANK